MNTTNERIQIATNLWVDELGRINLGYGTQVMDIGSLHDDSCIKAFAEALHPHKAPRGAGVSDKLYQAVAMMASNTEEGAPQGNIVTNEDYKAVCEALDAYEATPAPAMSAVERTPDLLAEDADMLAKYEADKYQYIGMMNQSVLTDNERSICIDQLIRAALARQAHTEQESEGFHPAEVNRHDVQADGTVKTTKVMP